MRKLKTSELNRITPEEFKKTEKIPLVVVLDNVRSMYNVGSVFRSCDAFAVESLFLCGITPVPPHREIHKTAIGATDSVNWKYFETVSAAVDFLYDSGYLIVALEQTDTSIELDNFIPEKNQEIAIILGNEVSGISDDILDKVNISLEIPQFGTKHSLNVSVAAGISIYYFSEKLRKG